MAVSALLSAATVVPAFAATLPAAVDVKMNYRTSAADSTYAAGRYANMTFSVNTYGLNNGVSQYNNTGTFGWGSQTQSVGMRIVDVVVEAGKPAIQAAAYCIEIRRGFWTNDRNGYRTYEVNTTLSAITQEYLGKLAHLAWDQVNNAVTAAAYQLAVWEISHDYAGGALNLGARSTGGIGFAAQRGTGTQRQVFDQAQAWLNTIKNDYTGHRQMVYLRHYDPANREDYQDLIVDLPLPEPELPAPVPVPAAGFLLIGGLGALAALRRRQKQA